MNRQSGYVMVATLLSLALFTTAMAIAAQRYAQGIERGNHEAFGSELALIAEGVRGHVAAHGLDSLVEASCVDDPCEIVGIDWLKDASCDSGVGDARRVPCAAQGLSPGGESVRFFLTIDGGRVFVAVLGGVGISGGSDVRLDLAAEAARRANIATLAVGAQAIWNAWHDDLGLTWPFDPLLVAPPRNGEIFGLIDLAAVAGEFFRLDGTTPMQANANFGGFDLDDVGTAFVEDVIITGLDNQSVAEAWFFGGLGAHGTFVRKPTCEGPSGSGTPQILVSLGGFEFSTTTTEALAAAYAYVRDCEGNSEPGMDDDPQVCGTTPSTPADWWQIKAFARGTSSMARVPLTGPDRISATPVITRCVF